MNNAIVELWESVLKLFNGWYWVPLTLAYVGVIVSILLDNRHPVKTIAYIMLLSFVPVLGLVVFFFFGRDYRKKRLFSIKGAVGVKILDNFWTTNEPEFEKRFDRLTKRVGPLTYPAHLLFNLHQAVITEHNAVQVLINGEQKFPEVYEAIKNAKHHIHIEYYIFTYDEVGKKIVNLLIDKAKEGVIVRFVIDDMGSKNNKRMVRKLRRAGIEVHRFMPVMFAFLAQANYRNHRKIIVIDGQVGFMGGINIDERYINDGKRRRRRRKVYWRDTHLKVVGPFVNTLQLQFLLSWHFTSKKTFPVARPYFESQFPERGNVTATLVASGPDSPRPYCMEAIVASINQAQQKILITTPYFIPSDQVMTALMMAASNGVDVQLILPGKGDSLIVQFASFSYLTPLLRAGVRVFLYERGFVHAKTLTIDGKLAIVGTTNLDTRSFFINFELAALLYDQDLCNTLDTAFQEDLHYSREVHYTLWSKRPLLKRFADSLCRLLTPLL